MPEVPGRPVFQAVRQRLQVLLGLRELQLQGLHHGEVLRQRAHVSTKKKHCRNETFENVITHLGIMKKTFPSHFRRHFLVLSGSRGGGGGGNKGQRPWLGS